METIELDGKLIAVNELNIEDAKICTGAVLVSANKIINAYKKWDSALFNLSIERPKLFYKLLSASTGKSKKFIKSLKAKDFDTLAFVFLSVNAEFFIQRLKLMEMSSDG